METVLPLPYLAVIALAVVTGFFVQMINKNK